ncbi:central apparatus associated protein C1a-18 [Trypanosoma grayi]|uniref:central apparatus associated protein C1a-18 n=1 Tax=Trypanosoma grayi TaxID=71804 RepID=UPI0004F43C67|nr:central apparatus associated protein C1a-18 [Trypanosoma grayi]KEG10401.1 central apparatus associated protein C1a-18 [Trypanosoma grayi]
MQKETDKMKRKKDEVRDEEGSAIFQYADGSVYEGKVGRREAPIEVPHGMPPLVASPPQKGQQQQEPSNTISFQQGKGAFKDAGGAVYKGSWSDGAMSGEGMLQFPSGAIYIGGFRSNDFYGTGMYKWPDGSYYEGQWESNKMHGLGTYVDAQGKRWLGKFFRGQGVNLLAEVNL